MKPAYFCMLPTQSAQFRKYPYKGSRRNQNAVKITVCKADKMLYNAVWIRISSFLNYNAQPFK